MSTVTTNNRERQFSFTDEDTRTYTAYGYTFTDEEVLAGTDSMRAKGYDGYFPAAVTNSGSAVIVLRYFDRDGYELDGFVAGWWVD